MINQTMHITQIDRFEMLQATNDYLDSHTEVWNGIPIVGSYKNQFTILLTAVKELSKENDMPRNFFSSSLRMIKKNISDKMDILDDTLEAYADDIQDADLRDESANSSMDYFSISHDEFEWKVKRVIELLEENIDAIADYGMTKDQIDDAKLTFNDYMIKRGYPKAYDFEPGIESTNIMVLFDEAEECLRKLDRVIKRFKRSNPSFYLGYLSARQVIIT